MVSKFKKYIRIRPFSHFEINTGNNSSIVVNDTNMVILNDQTSNIQSQFDEVINDQIDQMHNGQKILFDRVGTSILKDFEEGSNVLIATFGPTASGKTYSTFGKIEQEGLIFTIMNELFKKQDSQECQYFIEMFQIKNENVIDLLDKAQIKKFRQSQISSSQIKKPLYLSGVIEGLTSVRFNSVEEFNILVKYGETQINQPFFQMNMLARRNHIQLNIKVRKNNLERQITFLDLPGSEKVSHHGISNQILKEASSVNSTLGTFVRCLESIKKKKEFIPYRDSKVTRINSKRLNQSKVHLLFTISPSILSKDESKHVLRVANKL